MNATRGKRSTLFLGLMWATLLLGVDTCDDFHLGQLPGEDAGSGNPEAGQSPDASQSPDADTVPCDGCDKGEYCERTACGSDEGTCQTLPEGCTDQYEPVCGCDGKTYGNDCYAARAGVTVASRGECGQGGGGDRACEQCGDTEYCKVDACDSREGACTARPDTCNDVYQPVCGCDGKTYGNECEAAAAGVSVDTRGECGEGSEPPDGCEQCRDTEYCKVDACDSGKGTCAVLAGACDLIYEPVCGCDGKTYGNDCLAAAQGVNVASEGPCDGPCGGTCGDDEYCKTDSCGADAGECTEMPAECTLQYDPVCGCDGQTYGNACAAESAGVNVASEGECGDGDGEQCGGIAGLACSDANDFCDYERGTGCVTEDGGTISDASGFCQPRPDACTLQYDPVCGCDGQTYDNRCAAHSAGVSVAQEGECTK